MIKYLGLLFVTVAVLSVPSRADTTQCVSTPAPSGSVTVAITTGTLQGCTVPPPNNLRIVRDLSGFPYNNTEVACQVNGEIPAGWVITSFNSTTSCGGISQTWTLLNLNGAPSGGGQTQTVCGQSVGSIPNAWVTLSYGTSSACDNSTNNARNIKNTNGLATGTILTVCQTSNLPSGWVINSTSTTNFCVPNVPFETIENKNSVPPPPSVHATMQQDGNFVVFGASGSPVFATNTNGTGAVIIRVQDDGNFVVYASVWQAGTYATPLPGPFTPQTCKIATLLHAPQIMNSGKCIVSPSGQYMFYIAPGGMAYIYDIAHNVGTWSAPGTNGNPGAYVNMQSDGNLVVYNSTGTTALWNSGTYNSGSTLLNMENDGRIILYKPVWNTHTSRGWDNNSYPHPACDLGPGTGWTGTMGVNQCFVSPNGRYQLLLQSNAVLVLSDLSVNPPLPIWTSQ
jgi:hypothetical protein